MRKLGRLSRILIGEKSFRPDSFNFKFIQECWCFLEEDIFKFAMEFHKTATLPKAITTSFLALIIINFNPQGLNEHRRICLVGCLYKIISKILANRFKKVLASLISSSHTTFVPGRQILNGVLALNEIIDHTRKVKKECLIFKADFKQANDY